MTTRTPLAVVEEGMRAAGAKPSRSLAMAWLAAGVPLTLLMDVATLNPRRSKEIARDETREKSSAANAGRIAETDIVAPGRRPGPLPGEEAETQT